MLTALSIYRKILHLDVQEGNHIIVIPPPQPPFFTTSKELEHNSFLGFTTSLIQSPDRPRIHCLLGQLKKSYSQFSL